MRKGCSPWGAKDGAPGNDPRWQNARHGYQFPVPGAGGDGAATHGRVRARQHSGAFRNALDFREHERGFGFQSLLHLLVIFFGEFAGAIFELQVAQIIVNDVAALHKLIEMRAMRSGIGEIGLDHEHENQHGGRERDAGDHGERVNIDGHEADQHCGIHCYAAGVRLSIILLYVVFDLATHVFQHFRRDGRPGCSRHLRPMPYANNHYDQPEADGKRDGRKRVGEPIESARGRRRERRFAILLHESLQDRLVRFAARDALVDFLEFGFGDFARAGKCRARMAARAGGIAAAASAHELLADRVSSVGGLHGRLGEERRGVVASAATKARRQK